MYILSCVCKKGLYAIWRMMQIKQVNIIDRFTNQHYVTTCIKDEIMTRFKYYFITLVTKLAYTYQVVFSNKNTQILIVTKTDICNRKFETTLFNPVILIFSFDKKEIKIRKLFFFVIMPKYQVGAPVFIGIF